MLVDIGSIRPSKINSINLYPNKQLGNIMTKIKINRHFLKTIMVQGKLTTSNFIIHY